MIVALRDKGGLNHFSILSRTGVSSLISLSERACLRGSLMSIFLEVDVGYASYAGANSFVRGAGNFCEDV